MLEKVIGFVEKVCEVEGVELNEDTSIISDLELSSLEFLAFISEIEGAMGIRIKEKELRNIDTLGDLVELVENKMNM